MNAKNLFSGSAAMLFFLLLFSKPYVAHCQTQPNNNEPHKKVVRIEIDSTIDGDNKSGKTIVIVDGEQMPEGFEWTADDSTANTVTITKRVIVTKGEGFAELPPLEELDNTGTHKVIVVEKHIDDNKPSKRNRRNKPVQQKEVKVIEIKP